jgi:hypothetical protein
MKWRKKINKSSLRNLIILILLFNFSFWLKSKVGAQESAPLVDSLIDKICQRLASYPDFEKWQALVTTTYINADRNWQPEKIKKVKKILTVNGETRDEEILEAQDIEKGQVKDVTEDYRRSRLERLKKLKEESEKARKSGQKPAVKNQLTKDDLIPFSESKKALYAFRYIGEEELKGEKVYVIEARAKVKRDNLFEGKYYISEKTYDPLLLLLQPSKNPAFIKDFQVEIDLEPWGNQLVLKKSRIKVFGGFLFKTVRLVIEEDYSDFKVIV